MTMEENGLVEMVELCLGAARWVIQSRKAFQRLAVCPWAVIVTGTMEVEFCTNERVVWLAERRECCRSSTERH